MHDLESIRISLGTNLQQDCNTATMSTCEVMFPASQLSKYIFTNMLKTDLSFCFPHRKRCNIILIKRQSNININVLCMCMLSHFSRVHLFGIYCSPPGSFVHRLPETRRLEWLAMPSSRGSFWPRDGTMSLVSPALAGGFFTTSATISINQ